MLLPLNLVDRIVGSRDTKPEIEDLNLTSKKRLHVRPDFEQIWVWEEKRDLKSQ